MTFTLLSSITLSLYVLIFHLFQRCIMAITSRQFDQLSEMGISLWQSRTPASAEQTNQEHYLSQTQQGLTELSKQKIFSDILLSLNLTIGEVKAQDNHLDVGLFNWYFLLDEKLSEAPEEKPIIHYLESKLISPSIDIIAQSSSLKKQLWHTISNNLL